MADEHRGSHLIRLLEEKAPDSHAALQRVSLQTGVDMEALRAPERLDDAQVVLVEDAIKRILGTDDLTGG